MSFTGDALEHWMDRAAEDVPEWSEPECYDPTIPGDRRQMYSRIVMGGARVQRKVTAIAEDMFEVQNPDLKNDAIARQRFMEPIVAEGDRFGRWHYFPWSNVLVQFADPETHWQLLAERNKELISADESQKLRHVTTGHVGLSVGSHIIEQTSHMALGDRVLIADHDVVSVPNLNRINIGMPEVGMRKTDTVGIRLSELNPYVKQVHFRDGITPANVTYFERHKPDLIFEEVDHMPTKVLLRKVARQVGAALMMATDAGELSMLDVERYDDPNILTEPFLGLLNTDELQMIERGSPTYTQTVKLIENLIGSENMSPRLRRSMGQIGITLGGIAQLGTTAIVGGAYAAIAGKEILLGRGPATGRYRVSPQELLNIPYAP